MKQIKETNKNGNKKRPPFQGMQTFGGKYLRTPKGDEEGKRTGLQ